MVSGRGEGCLYTEKETAKFNPSSKSCVKEATAGERTLQPTASNLSPAAAASANGANRCFQTNRPHWRTLSHPLSQFSHRFLSLSPIFSLVTVCPVTWPVYLHNRRNHRQRRFIQLSTDASAAAAQPSTAQQ